MTGPAPIGRLAWLVVDGLPRWLVERALGTHAGRLPALARLHADGRLSALAPLEPNCQTPPSLAALFTGAGSNITGLSGFDVPDFADPARLATRRAFDCLADEASPFWERLAASGVPLALCHVPFVRRERLGTALAFYRFGFSAPTRPPAVLAMDDAADVLGGVAPADLDEGRWTSVDFADAGAMVVRRRIGGEDRILFTGTWPIESAGRVDHPGKPAFMASGLQHDYRRGELGPTLTQNGDGEAEALFVETVRQLSRRYTADWLDLVANHQAGLAVAYQPALDLALHELTGFLADDCDHWTASREGIVWPLLVDLLSDIDACLGATLQLTRERDRVIVTSDHGMSPVDTVVRPNRLLKEHGWLEQAGSGQIDPCRSVCFYHPAENGLVCLNLGEMAARQLDEGRVLAELARMIKRVTGRPCAVRTWPAIEASLSPPSWLTARHVLHAGRYVQAKSDLSGPACAPSAKTGEHVVANGDDRLQGTVIDLSPEPIGMSAGTIATHDVASALVGSPMQRNFHPTSGGTGEFY